MLLKVENVSKCYFGKTALTNINYSLEKGKITGLLGPNGSGKSTLLKIIAGLIPCDSGNIYLNEKPLSYRTKADVAYLPEVDIFPPNIKVKEILAFYNKVFQDFNFKKAKKLLNELGLQESLTPNTMSKGMRTRLKVVVTLARECPLLLLDEPLSGIDPLSRDQIIKAIAREFASEHQSIILSTHEVFESEGLFDEIILLNQGSICLRGDAEQLRESSSLRKLLEEVYR